MKAYSTIALLVFLFMGIASKGQGIVIDDSCTIKLTMAQKSFEKGNFEEVIFLLQRCLIFNRREAVEGLRLMAISYMFIGDKDKADKTIMLLLKRNPQYLELPNPADPAEFSRLVSQYKVEPKGSIGVNFGLNKSLTEQLANYQTSGSATEYRPLTGVDAGAEYQHHYGSHWRAGIGFTFLWVNYNRYMPNVNGWNEQNIERFRYNSIGITGQYGTWFKKVRPFVGLDLRASYLAASRSEISYKLIADSSVEVVNDIDSRANRHGWQYWATPSAGVSFLLGNSASISLSAFYSIGLRNMVNPDNRYSSNTFIFNHYYLDDDFRIHLPGIRLSFLQTVSKRVVKK